MKLLSNNIFGDAFETIMPIAMRLIAADEAVSASAGVPHCCSFGNRQELDRR